MGLLWNINDVGAGQYRLCTKNGAILRHMYFKSPVLPACWFTSFNTAPFWNKMFAVAFHLHVNTETAVTKNILPLQVQSKNIAQIRILSLDHDHTFAFLHTWCIKYAAVEIWYFIDFQCSTWHLSAGNESGNIVSALRWKGREIRVRTETVGEVWWTAEK